jgi:CheY-like chemotaxis protein
MSSWGWRISLVDGGLQALQVLEQQQFDLVLLDIRMPDIDGLEVARRIRQREQEFSLELVTIIAITADADTATRQACLKVGIDTVLAKPISEELLARGISGLATTISAESQTGELTLNPEAYKGLGNNPERVRQYQEMLLSDICDEIHNLQIALEADNRDALGRAAHTLKGLCGHLADREQMELAVWLQDNAQSAPLEQLRPAVEKLQSMCPASIPTTS